MASKPGCAMLWTFRGQFDSESCHEKPEQPSPATRPLHAGPRPTITLFLPAKCCLSSLGRCVSYAPAVRTRRRRRQAKPRRCRRRRHTPTICATASVAHTMAGQLCQSDLVCAMDIMTWRSGAASSSACTDCRASWVPRALLYVGYH